ncbi:UbiA family prenyltransferase [Nocardia arthritidis]|uniref:Prenyltransferase n=1 Tax=Nocardia arthritidis TaxID=228602 RepID=A0A6G9YAS9_9NOCA|nr:UbiA family prenyltransferase [Nocardia arthritidis]QIS10230.1 hypothetical protein F5544_11690 [Nocardia arthritidis]
MSVAAPALESLTRVARFTAVMYKPHYLVYGILWVLAVEGTAAVAAQPYSAWRPGGATVVRIVVVAVVLLYLRMVDEQKDLEYDRVHNPDRPLVTGAVSANELRAAMAVLGAVTIALSLTQSFWSAVMLTATLLYGLALWALEARSVAVRGNALLNLAVTYPIQLLLAAYVLTAAAATGQVHFHWRAALVVLIFTGAFLHFEFARKTAQPPEQDEHSYSAVLGPTVSAVVTLLLAAGAVVTDLLLLGPGGQAVFTLIPLVLLLIPGYSTWTFLRGERPVHPVVPSAVFVLAFYAVLIVQALVRS